MNVGRGRNMRGVVALVALTALAAVAAPTASAAVGPVRADAVDRGQVCSLAAQAAAAPVGLGPCVGVRPGAAVVTGDTRCTLAFMFQGANGTRYAATAGHCVLGEGGLIRDVGETTWAPGTGPVAEDGSGNRIGEFAYAILDFPGDFALIRLDPGVQSDPQLCHFGGPTGTYTQQGSDLTLVQYVGQGTVVGEVLPARSGLAPDTANADRVFAISASVPGDSGGPVTLQDGRAVGLIQGLGEVAFTVIVRLAPQVERAEQALGTSLTLQQAPTR